MTFFQHKAELIVAYDEETSLPSAAACLVCGEYMPQGDRQDLTAEDRLRWFKAIFELHARSKHSAENIDLRIRMQ
jgi:hypothetical protein